MIKVKPFEISRHTVYKAYQQVRGRKGVGGVDKMSLEDFDKDCTKYLYRIWNQMSSGSYMAPAVKLVEIPKKGGGLRPLGIPTICDRIAQTVVKLHFSFLIDPNGKVISRYYNGHNDLEKRLKEYFSN